MTTADAIRAFLHGALGESVPGALIVDVADAMVRLFDAEMAHVEAKAADYARVAVADALLKLHPDAVPSDDQVRAASAEFPTFNEWRRTHSQT